MKKNSPEVWDQVWDDPALEKNDTLILKAEQATIRWKKIEEQLLKEFGSLKNLSVIEIGAGTGTYAALIAKLGARATLLDYSPKALQRAKVFFKNNNLDVTLIEGDALKLPKELTKKPFDISISVGLTEHFKGEQRVQINKTHVDVLKKGGLAIIMVPNKFNLPYRIYKKVSEVFGRWKFGEEYPYSQSELRVLVPQINADFVTLFGDDLYTSLKFLMPANFLRRFFRVGSPKTEKDIRQETGTFLDDYLGYALTLIVRKK